MRFYLAGKGVLEDEGYNIDQISFNLANNQGKKRRINERLSYNKLVPTIEEKLTLIDCKKSRSIVLELFIQKEENLEL